MNLTFLGTGAAFSAHNYHSNVLLTSGADDRLLIDCGSDARFSLADQGLGYRDIDKIYISHIHADHVGGLEWIGFSRKFDPSCDKLACLISHKEILKRLWDNSLSGGMQSMEDIEATLTTYFDLHPIAYPGSFQWQGVNFEIVRTYHIYNDHKLVESYGLFFALNGTKIFLTTDTTLNLQSFESYYNNSDLIFHDCETTKFHSGVHSHYEELLTLPAHVKRKIWLYHYNDGPLPNATKDGFQGFVVRGQSFSF